MLVLNCLKRKVSYSKTNTQEVLMNNVKKIDLFKIEYTFPLKPDEKSSNKEVLVLVSNGSPK